MQRSSSKIQSQEHDNKYLQLILLTIWSSLFISLSNVDIPLKLLLNYDNVPSKQQNIVNISLGLKIPLYIFQ